MDELDEINECCFKKSYRKKGKDKSGLETFYCTYYSNLTDFGSVECPYRGDIIEIKKNIGLGGTYISFCECHNDFEDISDFDEDNETIFSD